MARVWVLRRQLPRTSWLVAAMLVGVLLAWLPVAAQGAEPHGVAQLGDDQAALDRLTVHLADLPAAPGGHTYRLWLLSGDGQRALLVAEVAPDPDGAAPVDWSHPAGENLLGPFSRVVLTLEQEGAPDGPPGGEVVIEGGVDRGALGQARRMLFRWPDSRYGSGSLDGLRQLSSLLRLHVAILVQDARDGKVEAVQRKAEHVVNLIEGSRGGHFGDHNRDGLVEDPGDGEGLLRYAWAARGQARIAWAGALDSTVAERALAVERPLLFVLDWAGFARDTALELAEIQDVERARQLAAELSIAADRVAAGVDGRQDRALELVVEEFGRESAAAGMHQLVRFSLNGEIEVEQPRTHVVQPGEQLRQLAARYGLSLASLVEANQLANPDLLQVGQVLVVPGAEGVH